PRLLPQPRDPAQARQQRLETIQRIRPRVAHPKILPHATRARATIVRCAPPPSGLTPAADPMTARWVVDALRDRSGVANVVPTGYDAYVRIQHRLDTGSAANVTGNLPSESID